MKQELSEYLVQFIQKESASKKEVAILIKQIIDSVNKLKENLQSDIKSNTKECKDMVISLEKAQGAIEKSLMALVKDSEKKTQDKAFKDLNSAIYNLEKQIKDIDVYDDTLLQEKFTLVVADLEKKIDSWKQFELKGEEIVDEINKLSIVPENLIKKEHVEGLVALEKKVNSIEIRPSRIAGGGWGLDVSVDGVSQGKIQYLNLIAGTNITLTSSTSGSRHDILIDASGGGGSGFTKLTATGTVDSSNTDFTFTQKPLYIISDGAWYTENKGWTWSGLTATMSVPPSGDIYGFV